MSAALNALLSRADIWRGASLAADAGTAIATGHARLDRELPGGGWPTGALTEIISARRGIGEIGLLAPALARLTQAHRWIAWIAPPAQLHAPALAQFPMCKNN